MPQPAFRTSVKPNSLPAAQPKSSLPRAVFNGRAGAGGRSKPTPRVRIQANLRDEPEVPAEEPEAQEADGDKAQEGEQEEKEDEAQAPVNDEAAKKKAAKKAKQHPQKIINQLWKNYDPVYLGRVTKVLPDSVPVATTPKSQPQKSHHTSGSYQEARAQCERDVQRIITECRALNQKYSDVHFDIERDLKVNGNRDCLDGLVVDEQETYWPQDVKRVTVRSYFFDCSGY